MKTAVIIQARVGSTPLPGNVVRVLGNATVRAHVVRGVRRACDIDEVAVAATELPWDDAIVEGASTLGVRTFRSSANDVLSLGIHSALVIASSTFALVPDLKRKLVRCIRRYARAPKPVSGSSRTSARCITTASRVTVH